jgi:hypothetical protein
VPYSNDIARVLRNDVFRAKRAYEVAHSEFMAVANDIPSQLPQPDGTARIINAGKAYRSTMDIYSRTLREFNNYIATGDIPDRIKENQTDGSAAAGAT